MREVKFRGLTTNSEEPKWLYGSLVTGLFHNINTKEDCAIIVDTTGNPDFDCLGDLDDLDLDVDIKTVGQYTGLKDKNGVEIYEGDIYEMYGHNYKIVFDNGAFCITGVKRHATTPINWKPETEDDCMIEDFAFNMEIIGNIHQNPELL
ncbi:MAG TPA: YopX family protein [Candidatus Brocadiaceae bacterium]